LYVEYVTLIVMRHLTNTISPPARYVRPMRWANLAKNKLKTKFRAVFEIESNPKYMDLKIDQKMKLVNELNKEKIIKSGKDHEFEKVSKAEYEFTIRQIQDDPRLKQGVVVTRLFHFQNETLYDDVIRIRELGIKNSDYKAIQTAHKMVNEYNLHLMKLLGLGKNKEPKRYERPLELNFIDPTK